MSLKKLAQNYLRYWSSQQDGTHALADNAPAEMRRFLQGQPANTDQQMIFQMLTTIATGQFPTAPGEVGLLVWFAQHPKAIVLCDDILEGKNPPKNLAAVLRNAYLAEAQSVRKSIQHWLQSQIDQF